jgi:hypothetical protein
VNGTLDDGAIEARLRRTFDAIANATVVHDVNVADVDVTRPRRRGVVLGTASLAAALVVVVAAVVVWTNVRGSNHVIVGDGDGATVLSTVSSTTSVPAVVEQRYEELPVPDALRAPLGTTGMLADVRAGDVRAFRIEGSPAFAVGNLQQTATMQRYKMPGEHCVVWRVTVGDQAGEGTASCSGGKDLVVGMSRFPSATDDVVVWGTVPANTDYVELTMPGRRIRVAPVAGTAAFLLDGRRPDMSADIAHEPLVFLRAYAASGKVLDEQVTRVRAAPE